MNPTCNLSKDEDVLKVYRGMLDDIYILLILDLIFYLVFFMWLFPSDPSESHIIAVKTIFRYLKGAINIELFYRQINYYMVVGFCDVNYTEDRVERKNISERC